jgi:hypothetical protein
METRNDPLGSCAEQGSCGEWHSAFCERPHGFIGVGAHLIDSAAASESPGHGGQRLGVRVGGLCRILMLS